MLLMLTASGMEMPKRGPRSRERAATIKVQKPYWRMPAAPLPSILPNMSWLGDTEESMISTVLDIFS